MAMRHIREMVAQFQTGNGQNLLSIIKCRLSYEKEREKNGKTSFLQFTKEKRIGPLVNLDIVLLAGNVYDCLVYFNRPFTRPHHSFIMCHNLSVRL